MDPAVKELLKLNKLSQRTSVNAKHVKECVEMHFLRERLREIIKSANLALALVEQKLERG